MIWERVDEFINGFTDFEVLQLFQLQGTEYLTRSDLE